MNTLSYFDLLRAAVFGILFVTFGCAGPARVTLLAGTCEANFDACLNGCEQLKDPYDCRLQCRFRGKLCSRESARARTGNLSKAGQLLDEVSIVDLSGPTVLSSRSAKVKLSPEVKRERPEGAGKGSDDYRVIKPAGTIVIDYELPAQTHRAELLLRHGPAGQVPQCFLTIMLDEQTLVGRYSPPRSAKGALRTEKWDLSNLLRKTKRVNGKRTFRLLILNNQSAGSRDDYRIGSVELYFQIQH